MKLLRTHYCGKLSERHLDEVVILNGWVKNLRNHGALIFVDLLDSSGVMQIVFDSKFEKQFSDLVSNLHLESVIAVKGQLVKRSEDMVNHRIASGALEVRGIELYLCSKALSLPFPLSDARDTDESLLLKYRFLDLRRESLKENLIKRYKVSHSIRNFLDTEGFVEIETPLLTKSTPEGARDFLVPSRIQLGHCYALPQSPQLFKQLLMMSKFERYYQIARCFRDEDLRSDRQPEFTQIDLEMAFVDKKQLMQLMERMFVFILKDVYRIDIPIPFSVISYDDAIQKYGTDKPDVRFDMPILNISDIALRSNFPLFQSVTQGGGKVLAINAKKAASFSRSKIESLSQFISPFGAKGFAWTKITGKRLASGVAKYFDTLVQNDLIEQVGGEDGDLLLFLAGDPIVIYESLGKLRIKLAEMLDLIDRSKLSFLWVVNFPLFEYSSRDNRYKSFHHPFTLPCEGHMHLLEKEPLSVQSESYDLVLNGVELGGGSLRIYNKELQESIFKILGMDVSEYTEQFGFFLNALQYGTPPHGGIAFGLDRLMMILQKENSIRNVIAFPKTQKGSCLLSGAPALPTEEQLMDLHIKLMEFGGAK